MHPCQLWHKKCVGWDTLIDNHAADAGMERHACRRKNNLEMIVNMKYLFGRVDR
jgi:hypothetical protein